MFVDAAMLHSGASGSGRASEHANEGATHLSSSQPVAGMFGDFAAADAFHEALSVAHAYHVETLQRHREVLSDIGAKAHLVASSFSEMENRHAKALRDVR